MKGITLDQYGQLHTYLLVQHGNVKISNLVLINAASYMEKNGTLDRLFEAFQSHNMIRIKVECLGLDSTSIKVHQDGTGVLKKTDQNLLVNRAADGQQKFMWLPRMIDAL